jgi:type II secretory pathway predicted ATPase ExeA
MKTKNDMSPAEFFGWRRHPFSDAYPLAESFLCEKEKRTANAAVSLFGVGKSLALAGPSGSGKSTLLQYIFSQLDPNYYRTVLIHYGGLQRNGLLRAVADHLGVETNTRSLPLLMKLQKHILEMSGNQNGLYPVIAVDDAQLLERESLMDLCSLIVSPKKKTSAASLILAGDEHLAQKMDLDLMKPIKTRLTAIFRQEPLSEKDSEDFIRFRLEQAGAPTDLIMPDAATLIVSHCRGNRRQIMNVATLLLEEAFFRKEKTITSQLVLSCDLIDISG